MAPVIHKKKMLDQYLRDEIVAVVLSLVEADHAITMDEVASRCGVAKGTLYNYFKNKQELTNVVHETITAPLRRRTMEIFESRGSALKRLFDLVDHFYRASAEYATYISFDRRNISIAESSQERSELLVTPLIQLCCEGIENGEFVAADPYLIAQMLCGLIIGPMEDLPYRRGEIHDPEKMQEDVKQLIQKLLSIETQEKL
jgi:AcrR family transcriptional regulator